VKALILAAGKGSRLPKVTEHTPKPMIEFRGKPILLHNIELCRKFGIDEILINTSHLANKITDYFGDGNKMGVKIKYSFENDLLGTSGALNNFKSDLNEDFFVIYGDNYSEIDLSLLIKKRNQFKSIAAIAFHFREDVTSSGVAEFDSDGKILKFIEKPGKGETDSHWVNAGIYYLTPEIFKYIPDGFSDFGKDIFPRLLSENESIYGVCYKSDVLAFDTPEMYDNNKSDK
jgi:mannose-1-phosphate guanylyltransferase